MEKVSKMVFVVAALSASALLGVYFGMRYTTKVPELGSVNASNEYRSFTVTTTYSPNYVKTSPGALGSVVIVSSTAGSLVVLDADGTTTSTLFTTDSLLGEGTYTFDRALNYGLHVSSTGVFDGQFVVTYR